MEENKPHLHVSPVCTKVCISLTQCPSLPKPLFDAEQQSKELQITDAGSSGGS